MAALECEVTERAPRIVRSYSKEERAQALALYDRVGSLDLASETLGIPKSTLATWQSNTEESLELRTKSQQDLAEKFEMAAHRFLDLASKKAKRAQFNHLMTGAGIAVDKMQLLRGLPTSINAEVERQELVVILQSALAAGLEGEAIDVTPEPDLPVSPVAQIEP